MNHYISTPGAATSNFFLMNVKIDTKGKFAVITPLVADVTANMTGELKDMLLNYLQKDIPHVILRMADVINIDEQACIMLADVQQQFYDQHSSFVICELQKQAKDKLDKLELLEILNVTLTESEAWDIVQMEEIEREISGGEG